MPINDFDEAALNRETGLSDGPIVFEDTATDTIRINADDKSVLDTIGSQAPTGITTPAPKTAPAIPDYLAPHIPAPVEKQAIPEKNWAEIWQKEFAEAPVLETIDQNSFESELVRRESRANYLAQQAGLDAIRELSEGKVNGKVDDLAIVQNTVRAHLRSNGIRSKEIYDQEVSQYVVDGQLTDLGKDLVEEQKTQAKTQLTQAETAANTYADTVVGDLNKFYTTLDATAQSFKPFGLMLDEQDLTDMREDIRSGRTDAWLETNASVEEAAEKAFWLALISSPERRAKLIQLADKRGQDYGANRRLGAQL